MPSGLYFDIPFAANGNLNTIPDATQTNGSVSYNQGFGALYSTAVASGGLNVPRTAINQALFDITSAIQNYQQNCIPPFITSAMNGGSPYSYAKYAVVFSSGVAYISLKAANTDTPPSVNWAVFLIRSRLQANTTFYVSTTGSDSTGNGTSAAPWATIQTAWNQIGQFYDLAGYSATIQLADGTYSPAGTALNAYFNPVGVYQGNGVIINGNSGSPSNVVISPSTGGANCFAASQGATYQIQNLKMQASTGQALIQAQGGGQIIVGAGVVFGSSTGDHALAQNSGYIDFTANYSITGGATNHVQTYAAGSITNVNKTITLTGTPNFSNAFAQGNSNGFIDLSGNTFSGSATGTRYNASLNGAINVNGAGATYLPGNASGTTSTGGQYN